MKTIHVSTRSRSLTALLDQARDEDVLVQTEDGTQFVLSAVDDFAVEIEAQRRNKKLMAILDDLGKETKTVPFDQAMKELGLEPYGPRKKKSAPKRGRKK